MNDDIRPGEVACALPGAFDAGLYFIGRIRTPWARRADCPRRGDPDGPLCLVEIDARWRGALAGLETGGELQLLYFMHEARRDLVLQTPRGRAAPVGTFALRSPVRPNPIASSIVQLETIEGGTLGVRGLDCLDGTPLVDIKPWRPARARSKTDQP
ncbi:MAG: SAM-dependent methyltransferase [Hyphomicrobiales bacterium]|nr:SAM-dependent methyltransferase [Hyphomicrobiales bacterium]